MTGMERPEPVWAFGEKFICRDCDGGVVMDGVHFFGVTCGTCKGTGLMTREQLAECESAPPTTERTSDEVG
jgi:DnaJ-class molecular chaperone